MVTGDMFSGNVDDMIWTVLAAAQVISSGCGGSLPGGAGGVGGAAGHRPPDPRWWSLASGPRVPGAYNIKLHAK